MQERTRAALREAGLPEDAALGTARMTMIGNGVMRIENHRGLLELTPERIRLRTQDGIVTVEGVELRLRILTAQDAEIEGTIHGTSQ